MNLETKPRTRIIKEELASSLPHTHPKITKRVLLIHPEDDLRQIMQMGLEMTTNWQIFSASSSLKALHLAKEQLPQAVLINVALTDVDTVINAFRQALSPLQLPIIVLVERVRLGDQQRFADLGIAGAIATPFDAVHLGQHLQQILNW